MFVSLVSEFHKSNRYLPGCHWLTGSHGVSVRDPLSLWAHLQTQLKDGYFHNVDRIVSYDSESLPPSLLDGEKPPSVTTWSHHRPSPQMAASFRKSKPAREIGREVGRGSHRTLCNLIFEVTRHYFCHVLFIRSESKGPVHNQREGIAEVRSWSRESEASLPGLPRTCSRLKSHLPDAGGEIELSLGFFPFEGKMFFIASTKRRSSKD